MTPQTKALVERLRDDNSVGGGGREAMLLCDQAADKIEALTRSLASKDEALRSFEQELNKDYGEHWPFGVWQAWQKATAAGGFIADDTPTEAADKIEALTRSLVTASTALERMADPRNIHFAGDAQALAKITLAALKQGGGESPPVDKPAEPE